LILRLVPFDEDVHILKMDNKVKRLFFLGIGWFFAGLGIIGVFLPVLPTVPFMLVAAWAFSKSSDRLRDWLHYHPKFGHHIRAWFEEGAITKKAKIIALSFMTLSFALSIYLMASLYASLGLLVIYGAVAVFIVTRPLPVKNVQQT
jgi:uncharacterized membrane protein YbaN (DUF454 family)